MERSFNGKSERLSNKIEDNTSIIINDIELEGNLSKSFLQNEYQNSDRKKQQSEKGNEFDNIQLPSCWQKFLVSLRLRKPTFTKRKIYLNGQVTPEIFLENKVANNKYNPFTFVPIVLFNQFKFFFNMYFLLLAISQYIPVFTVPGGLAITYLAPLVLIMCLIMTKEAYDDIKRYRRDQEANKTIYRVMTREGLANVKSCDIKIGQILEVNRNQRIPADMVLLYVNDKNGEVFVRTDQMDGETDWKLRKSIKITQSMIKEEDQIHDLYSLNANVKALEPIEQIYEFQGLFTLNNEDGSQKKESLTLENTLWANTVLASGKAYGLVVYIGPETRMALNTKQPRTKFGRIDLEINFLAKILFSIMVFCSLILMIVQKKNIFDWDNFLEFTKYLILISSIIPISMRVNTDFAKLYYSYSINTDKAIEGTVARNSSIPEELGRIQFLLSDKTGTLTQNDMIFRKISLQDYSYTQEDIKDINTRLQNQCKLGNGPAQYENKKQKRQSDQVLRDLITALAVCHNVTPTYDDQGNKQLQASSPDEISLVKTAEDMGIVMEKRDSQIIKLKNAIGEQEDYQILNVFPFSSETKRMGIIVKHVQTDQYIYYMKGADVVMIPILKTELQKSFALEECGDLAREGLRTLVITQKALSEKSYQKWLEQFNKADQMLENRHSAMLQVMQMLENNMDFLGITGVEDKLQENVQFTIENLRNAGIQIWMLTGDKIETAICISISTGLKSHNQKLFQIKEKTTVEDVMELVNQFNEDARNTVLVIDGTSLKTIIDSPQEKAFFDITSKAPAVVCCRCSPTQKSQVVLCIKKYTGKITCAIGDGGNDVAMIQSADVGVGIVGKEGIQAALSSDYSILKFSCLDRLLLWHGRLSYKRTAVLSQFVLHRGMVISFIQYYYIILYGYIIASIFDGMLLLCYSTIFTMFPVFVLILDEDVTSKTAMQFPPLYKTLQKGRDLNAKTFLFWTWKAIFQGYVIIILSYVLFENSPIGGNFYCNTQQDCGIETISFTALIMMEYMLCLSELSRIHIIQIISNVGSFLIYVLILLFFQNFFSIADIIHWNYLGIVLGITLVSWLPTFAYQVVRKYFWPNDYEKIMKLCKRERVIETKLFSHN